MKVIDIYNKIANGEKVPKFKLKSTKENNYYWVDEYGVLVYSQSGLPDIYELTNIRYDLLNNEIEIIKDKEDKKIEKLDNNIAYFNGTYETRWSDSEMYIVDKLNEIIDKVNGEE
jgi:hypothetical protein